MRSIVIYSSRSGNTRRLAATITDLLLDHGSAETFDVAQAPTSIPNDVDLLILGAPTEGHGISKPMAAYLDGLEVSSLADCAVAVFDTRLDWPRLLSGSAAADMARRMRHDGATVLEPEGSFLVSMKPELESGEVEAAVAWAAEIADQVKARSAVLV